MKESIRNIKSMDEKDEFFNFDIFLDIFLYFFNFFFNSIKLIDISADNYAKNFILSITDKQKSCG